MLKKEFTLRKYQETLIQNLAQAVRKDRRVIACAATGAGKSKTFLRISVNAVRKGFTVLIITESINIYDQLIAEVHAAEINSENKLFHILPGGIYLAMAQTLKRRKYLIDQFKSLGERILIINDECHINQATGILMELPAALLIGFSGSPVGKHLVKLYNSLVVGPQPHELVLEGFLSPYRHFERKRADIDQLELDSTGEYSDESQQKVFSTDNVYEGLIDDLRSIEYKKGLIFTSNISHCEQTVQALRVAGFTCVSVHSDLKGKEDINLDEFRYGLTPLCVTVGMLTKGFDFAPIDLISLLIKTTSLAKYLQCIGRGSRVLKGEEYLPLEARLKQYFTVVDYGQNCTRHLPWDFERDWQTLWRANPRRVGVSPIKVCPQCDYVNDSHAKRCINCGYTWELVQIQIEQDNVDTILVEITAKYNKLVGRKISELNPEELAIYAKSKGRKQFAIRVAKWHAWREGREWLKEFAQYMNYKSYWVKITYDAMVEVVKSNPDEKFEFTDDILR